MPAYDAAFYDRIRAGAQRSAEIVVPLLLTLLDRPVDAVIDIGGGEGWFARAFREHTGCTAVCYDHGVETPAPDIEYVDVDLAKPFVPDRPSPFDIAVCLEVAEHLSPKRGPSLVAELTRLAPVVLFSAAIPAQPGNHHVNCRWPSYWERLFADHDYPVSDMLRWEIWDDERVEPWYRMNLLIAWDRNRPLGAAGHARARPGVVDVVHPEIWGWVT